MEPLTTGRRHIRAGSVHVTELIGKRPRPIEVGGPFPVEDFAPFDDGVLDTLLDPGNQPPSSHRRPPSRGAQLAKIAGLGVASFALCAAIAVGSMITHDRREDATASATRPTMDINGSEALLPDLLNQAVPGAPGGASGLPGPPARATETIENTRPARPATGPAHPAPGRPSGTPRRDDEPVSRMDLVERFYELAGTSPDKAFTLLDGTLLGTDLGQFVQSWSGVRDIEVLDVREQGNDVLAVVRMLLPDGSHLRVQQLLEVADTTPRRIVGAQILSAQRN